VLEALRTLTAIIRAGSFQAAGQQRGLTQSAISGQIRRLEEQLGYAVFDRTRRQATLTQAGRALLDQAQDILERCDALPRLGDHALVEAIYDGTLRMGAVATVQSTILAPAIEIFRARCPFARLHVLPGVSLHLVDQMDAGQIDAAVTVKPPWGLPAGLRWNPIAVQRFVLVAHRASLQDGENANAVLERLPFIRYDRTSFGGRTVDRFLRQIGVSPREFIEMDDVDGIRHAVCCGLGSAIIPLTRPLRGDGSEDGLAILQLDPKPPPREIGLIDSSARPHSLLPAWLDALRAAAENQPETI